MKITKKKKRKIFVILLILTGICLSIAALYSVAPGAIEAIEKGGQQNLESYLRSFGIQGLLITALLQVVQVLTVFFPAIPIQVAAGALYGMWKGMLVCYTTFILTNFLVFFMARKMHTNLEELVVTQDEKSRFSFFKKAKHPSILVFIGYMTPGLPNGIVPYLAARTNIRKRDFLFSMALGSLPFVLLNLLCGSHLVQGDYILTAVLAGLLILSMAAVVIWQKQLSALLERLAEARDKRKALRKSKK